MPRRPRPVVLSNVEGAFCPFCGASIKRLTQAELLVLASLLKIDREQRAAGRQRQPVRLVQIEDRSGLDHGDCSRTVARLRDLGYLAVRKAYGRAHLVYRLSGAALGDPHLIAQLEQEAPGLGTPKRLLTPADLLLVTPGP